MIFKFEEKMRYLKNFIQLVWFAKFYWLVPLVIVIMILGILSVVTSDLVVEPFVYDLF